MGGTPNFSPSPASNAWPATTVGRPDAPEILSVTGSKDAIKLVVRQAGDRTATSFVLQIFDPSGAEVSPAYSAPVVSVGAPDSERRQLVVFATDASRLGGTYRFKVRRGQMGWGAAVCLEQRHALARSGMMLATYTLRHTCTPAAPRHPGQPNPHQHPIHHPTLHARRWQRSTLWARVQPPP